MLRDFFLSAARLYPFSPPLAPSPEFVLSPGEVLFVYYESLLAAHVACLVWVSFVVNVLVVSVAATP